MTTYYHYAKDGHVETSTVAPAEQFAYTFPVLNLPSETYAKDPVGAYLAQRAMLYPAYNVSGSQNTPPPTSHMSGQPHDTYPPAYPTSPNPTTPGYQHPVSYDSQRSAAAPGSSPSHMSMFPSPARTYPNPDTIRHLHTLHSLLPHIQPERKLHSLSGPALNIIEADTLTILMYGVPKKLLVLFLGRPIVAKFLRTTPRHDNTVAQELWLPPGTASRISLKILVCWMARACQPHTMHDMQQLRIPQNTFAACSLAQTMEVLGLYKDALRVDMGISRNHFLRPIFARELEALWRCLGEESRYVYGAIKVVGRRLEAFERGGKENFRGLEDMLDMLEAYPELKRRVRDMEENEKFRPSFGTEWIRRLSRSTLESQTTGDGRVHVGYGTPSTQGFGASQPPAPREPGRRFGVLRIVAGTGQLSNDEMGSTPKDSKEQQGNW